MREPTIRETERAARTGLRRSLTPRRPWWTDWAIYGLVLMIIGVVAAITVPQLLGAREKARNATEDNIYVALNGEVANELDGAVNGGTGNLGPIPTVDAPATQPAIGGATSPPARTARANPVVVYSGEMTLGALDVRRAAAEVIRTAKDRGGFVVRQEITRGQNAPSTAQLSLRVPAASFEDVVEAIGSIGTVTSQTAKAVDETESQVDLDARSIAKQALEKRLLELLQRTGATLADTLEVEKELARVREDIEAIAGKRASLASSERLSALDVRIEELTGGARGFRGRLTMRFHAARVALSRAADAAGRVAADALLLVVPAGAVLGIVWWLRAARRRSRRARA